MAHEYNELGMHSEMLQCYQDLAELYPRSSLLVETLYRQAEYFFNHDKLDQAEKYYRKVLAYQESDTHAYARYKLGWVEVNRARHDKAHWKSALDYFRQVVVSKRLANLEQPASGNRREGLRSQAMNGIVFTYTEVLPAAGALEYFKKLSGSNTIYLDALEKLANRYFIKDSSTTRQCSIGKLFSFRAMPKKTPTTPSEYTMRSASLNTNYK